MSSQPVQPSPNWRNPQYILQIVLLVAILIVTAFGYQVNKPAPSGSVSAEAVVNNPLEASTLLCKAGTLNCVKAENGSQISAYSDAGTTKTFNVDGSTGDVSVSGAISVTGVITTNGGYIGITPVATATAMPTATPITALNGLNVATPGALSVAGTPVIPFATPQTLFLGNETAGQYIKCTNTEVTGSATATPIAGATPVGQPFGVSLSAVTGDEAHASGSYNAGTFTISVSGSALTPAPNTTPAAVEWCYVYTKAP